MDTAERLLKELQTLLNRQEEEITKLQAEAFDWRMRAEGAERCLREAEKKLVAAMKRSEQILEIDEDGTVHDPAAEAAERGRDERKD